METKNSAERLDPRRENRLKDRLLPVWTESSTDNLQPIMTLEIALHAEPIFEKFLKESELPNCVKLHIDIAEPRRA
jgi:hypothetical protein